jgi:hypothetical protein
LTKRQKTWKGSNDQDVQHLEEEGSICDMKVDKQAVVTAPYSPSRPVDELCTLGAGYGANKRSWDGGSGFPVIENPDAIPLAWTCAASNAGFEKTRGLRSIRLGWSKLVRTLRFWREWNLSLFSVSFIYVKGNALD